MKFRLFHKPAALVAIAALLVVSVSAATLLLSPTQVARRYQQPALADAFSGGDAILLNQRVETGDYAVTLLGLTTGQALTSWDDSADAHTYAVVALDRLDGTPLEQQTFPFTDFTLTPLVSGYAPWRLNNWSLHSHATGFSNDGTFYFLLDTQNLEMFADHTVYLAFYDDGFPPSRERFAVAEDGSISLAQDAGGTLALFTLPLDPNKADSTAVNTFFEDSGLGVDFFLPTPN